MAVPLRTTEHVPLGSPNRARTVAEPLCVLNTCDSVACHATLDGMDIWMLIVRRSTFCGLRSASPRHLTAAL